MWSSLSGAKIEQSNLTEVTGEGEHRLWFGTKKCSKRQRDMEPSSSNAASVGSPLEHAPYHTPLQVREIRKAVLRLRSFRKNF